MHHLSHEPYYRDRLSEYELCNDFPADEIFIDGLHAMQCHFYNNRVAIDIPVVRVMNTAHYIAAYMFSNECSGDQMEYDVLAYSSTGHDKKLAIVTMIVLAAMLQRTEGFRARQCRNVILDNRDPDFEEGVTLYDHFLRSAEKRFSEENFLIDVHSLVTKVHEQEDQIAELTSENVQLKYTLTTMEKNKPQTIVYNYGTYNDIHDNPHSTIYTTTPATPASGQTMSGDSSNYPDCQSDPSSSPASDKCPKNALFCRITKAAYDKGAAQQVEDDLRSASVSAPKLVKAINLNEALGYLDTKDLFSTDLYDLLNEHYHLPFKLRTFQDNRGK